MPEKCRMGIGILSLRKYILLEIFFSDGIVFDPERGILISPL